MSPYALIDANNFYVSCERVFDYSLRDPPGRGPLQQRRLLRGAQ